MIGKILSWPSHNKKPINVENFINRQHEEYEQNVCNHLLREIFTLCWWFLMSRKYPFSLFLAHTFHSSIKLSQHFLSVSRAFQQCRRVHLDSIRVNFKNSSEDKSLMDLHGKLFHFTREWIKLFLISLSHHS